MEGGNNQVNEGYSVAFGDVMYVKLRSGSWWPAQVVDDEAIAASLKPRNCREGEVLVRVYGSHLFMNVDAVKSCSEFEKILKNHNGDLQMILRESLVQSLPKLKKTAARARVAPAPIKKASSSKKKSNKKDEEQTKAKRQKQNKESKDDDLGSPSCETASGKLQELSSRRIRVMQNLGLSAPPGSPFIKVRVNYNKTP